MPAPTHDQLKALIQQETDMFDALVEASNDAYIVHRAWRELVLENEKLRKELELWRTPVTANWPIGGTTVTIY